MRQNTYKIINHDTDLGPVIPDGLPQQRHHRTDAEGITTNYERTVHEVQRNLVSLTHQVPMVAIEDLPEEMQQCTMGVLRDWVRLF